MKLSLLIFCIVSFVGDGACALEEVTPSQLQTSPSQFEGKHVHVRGYVVISPHGRNIFDSEASYQAGKGVCLGLQGTKEFAENKREGMETLSGIYKRQLCGPSDICLYWCGSSGLELDKDQK